MSASRPTCAELQTQIDTLREVLDVAHRVIQNDRADLSDLRKQLVATDAQLLEQIDSKLDAEASRMITADVKTALSTAAKYYEQAHAIYSDVLMASKQVYEISKTIHQIREKMTREHDAIESYYALPWYWRMFHKPIISKEKK